jgi:hypothetical protein
MADMINHPPHYTSHPLGVECITITEHMPFNVGSAIKYLWRAGLKTTERTPNLQKAAWYVAREIQRVAVDDQLDDGEIPDWERELLDEVELLVELRAARRRRVES